MLWYRTHGLSSCRVNIRPCLWINVLGVSEMPSYCKQRPLSDSLLNFSDHKDEGFDHSYLIFLRPKTRSFAVKVDFLNADGTHHINSFIR